VLDHLNIGVLVPIGGDDTLSYGARLHQENFPIVAIPKTMDNDVFGTDYCIGFSTAVSRSVQFIHQLHFQRLARAAGRDRALWAKLRARPA
jgi:6-phosphofructokinase 1